MKKVLALPIIVVAVISSAHAQEAKTPQQSSSKTSKYWYLGGKVGWANGSSACEAHATSCGNNSASGGVYLGYIVNDWLAVEGGYNYLGDITAEYPALSDSNMSAPYTGKMKGFEFVAKPSWKLKDSMALFAKVGTLAWDMHVVGQEIGYEHTADESGWSPLLGVGVEYAWNRHLSTSIEYQWVNNVGGASTGGTDMNLVNIAMTYHFAPKLVAEPQLQLQPAPVQTVHKTQVELFTGVPFPNGSSLLSLELKKMILPIIKHLREYPQATLVIKAHADSKGSIEFNQRLTDLRAQAVRTYIVEQGISSDRLQAVGYGETMPIASNMTEAGRHKNRRIEFEIPQFEVITTKKAD